MVLALRGRDIQHRHDIVMPGAWSGEAIDVTLDGGRQGRLQAIMQVDANTWHLRWLCPSSSLDGRIFELARMISAAHALSQQPDRWNCRLMLIDDAQAA